MTRSGSWYQKYSGVAWKSLLQDLPIPWFPRILPLHITNGKIHSYRHPGLPGLSVLYLIRSLPSRLSMRWTNGLFRTQVGTS